VSRGRWRWMLLIALCLLAGCGREPVPPDRADPPSGADPNVEARQDRPEGEEEEEEEEDAPEPAVAGKVEIAVDRALPTDCFVGVFPTGSPPSSLYRLHEATGIRWTPIASDGSFRFVELAPGGYSVLVSDGRFPLSRVTQVTVPSEAARVCRVVLETSYGHDIHVTDPTGKPAPNVEVTVLRTVGDFVFLGRTDSAGSFAIEEALIGDYLCNLKPPGARLPKPKGMFGVRHGPRDASYYQLRESDYR